MTDFRDGTLAVIFDLDGVIADTEPLHQLAFRRLLGELELAPELADDWHRFVGTADRPVLVELLRGRGPALEDRVDALLARKGELFLDLIREHEPIFPAIPALVEDLAARYRLAVASGSLRTAIAGVLALRDLRRHFESTLSVQDVAHGKPAPDLFLRTAEILGLPPAACVVIEDSVPGVTAARAAGMRVIAVTHTTPVLQLAAAKADAVATDYAEVRRWLLG